MRINIPSPILKNVLVAIVVIVFFGVVGYREIFKPDGARVAKAVAGYSVLTTGDAKDANYYGARRAQLAVQEYQKGVRETSPGCDCGPEIDKYTEGHHAQWCAMFASWITKEAGSPMVNPTGGWRFTNSRELASYLEKNGTWYSRDQVISQKLEPKPGDFLIYWRGDINNGLGHVDIMITPSDANGRADIIGGNVHDKVELRNIPFRDNYGFLGFGRPEKS